MKIKFREKTIELDDAETFLFHLSENFFNDILTYGGCANRHYNQVRRYFYDKYGIDLNDEVEVIE